ncbi:unnamed protein product [Moneuplotes crassus]|uniref:CN hydrolase domain-containing protein n=1 Tax=Euplotes crassus TaxID=5936 RepID=A0AAD1UCD9_EUPCR|nr:unnamed protein product [Moneuplotes crassus]
MQSEASRTLKVCSLQYKPVYKDIDESSQIADKLLSGFSDQDEFDVILLPEMAFAGYTFDDKEDIEPYLEEATGGKTFEWCASTAKRLKAYVFCGYPEKEGTKMYNSQLVVSPEGEFLKSYKKTYLYETDETWADEGPGFECMTIKNRAGQEVKIGNGICMDINPYKFQDESAPGAKACAFANYHADNDVEVILFSSNWVDSDLDKVADDEATMSTLNYWCYRLAPFMKPKDTSKKRYFACANRNGEEKGTSYVGSSCFLMGHEGKFTLLGNLSRPAVGALQATLKLD